MTGKLKRPFTGRHMTAILLAFFGTVIAVNVTMAMFATGTFAGTVVDNSYVASQHFNRWLDEAHAQEALGWSEKIGLDNDRRITIILHERQQALNGVSVDAIARHPLGRAPDVTLHFTQVSADQYRSLTPLPTGRWAVHFTLAEGSREKRLIRDIR